MTEHKMDRRVVEVGNEPVTLNGTNMIKVRTRCSCGVELSALAPTSAQAMAALENRHQQHARNVFYPLTALG